MKIATYNVRNLYDAGTFVDKQTETPISESSFEKRVEYFTTLFKGLDVDIICLQEIGGEGAVTKIGQELGYDFFFAKPNARGIRMAVLYKKALSPHITCASVSLGDLFIPAISEVGDTQGLHPITQRRDILEITLTTSEKTISINTFHLKSNLPQYLEDEDTANNPDAHVDAKFRCILYKTMELRAIKKHANSRLLEGKEIILLGDYNENNTASMMDILKSAQQDELRLDDVLDMYTGDKTTHIHRGGKLTFDTVLVSQGLKDKVTHVEVENKELKDCSQLPLDTEVIESDHALVWVDLDVRV